MTSDGDRPLVQVPQLLDAGIQHRSNRSKRPSARGLSGRNVNLRHQASHPPHAQATGLADPIHVFHARDAHHQGAEVEGRDDHLEELDEGVGQRLHLPPEQGGTVFDAFSGHQPGGTGMGLAICRSIAESHHGRIDLADSPNPLRAEFMLWLLLTSTPPSTA